jgi:hypothetical protein
MVKRLSALIILLACAAVVQAQYGLQHAEYSSFSFHEFYPGKKNISLSSDFYYGSTAITNKFFNYYYLGKFIDTELKNDVSRRLHDKNNRLGVGANASLMYTYKIKEDTTSKSIYYISIGSRHFAEANFSRDLFELYFRGNKSFEGESADFNNFHFRLYEYHKITWGNLIINSGDSAKLSFGYSGSVLLGQRFNDIKLVGNIYTAQHGEYLDVTANGTMHATDSAHTSIGSVNGYGASVDFYFRYPLSKSVSLQLLVSDLGFINWNNKTNVIAVDTSYHFEGVAVDDLFDFTDTVFGTSSLSDTAQANTFLTRHTKEKYSTVLPVKASLELNYMYNEKISFTLTDEMMTGDFFRNFIMLSVGWKASPKVILSLQASYGGYGNFNAGAVGSFLIGKEFALTAGSNSLVGLLFPAYFTSQSAFVSLKKYF